MRVAHVPPPPNLEKKNNNCFFSILEYDDSHSLRFCKRKMFEKRGAKMYLVKILILKTCLFMENNFILKN